ncbi:MAG: response regulator [Planctomycetaceae bacterium]|jgi:putative two-component system response regulator|nr:response regulator [Planctomycetaceae bacterium]
MSEKKQILVVDDNELQLKLAGQIISSTYNTMLVSSGRAALKYLEQNRPDLILLDVAMPEMDGIETFERIKLMPAVADVPVIFFTAIDDDVDELTGLRHGACDYLSKPILPELLHLRIRLQLELYDYRNKMESLIEMRTAQLRQLETVTIHALANITECRDTDTGNHIKRTSLYVAVLCKAALKSPLFAGQIDENMMTSMVTSAPLHDIGKVAIPDMVLNKPGKLSDEEFALMKQHVSVGEKALQQAVEELGFESFLNVARDLAGSHHERWDGKGYLKGLKDKEIPLSARIMSIADVYDALCAKRVYKAPMPHEKAYEIIVEGAGTQFDPHLVELFKQEHLRFAEINQQYSD